MDDQLFANYINLDDVLCNLRIQRIKKGQYWFGTKKIMTKVLGGKLMVRTGGGYMTLFEFVYNYGPIELQKQIKQERNEEAKVDPNNLSVPITKKEKRGRTLELELDQMRQEADF